MTESDAPHRSVQNIPYYLVWKNLVGVVKDTFKSRLKWTEAVHQVGNQEEEEVSPSDCLSTKLPSDPILDMHTAIATL